MLSDHKCCLALSGVSRLLRLLRAKTGAVTVFSVLLLSSLLLFFGLLIDYARITAMHKLMEDAARAGVRSVLSAYDAGLYEKYGLFGRGGTDGETIFHDTVQANLSVEQYSTGAKMKVVSVQLEGTELHTSAVLGDHRVFARQILEDMKYKAPIDFTLEIIAKFAPLANSLKASSSTIDVLEQLRKLYDQREAELEKTLRHQRYAAAEANISSELKISADFSQRYEQYCIWVQHDEAADVKPKYEKEIMLYKGEGVSITHRLQTVVSELEAAHASYIQNARSRLETAIAINEQMRAVMAESEQSEDNESFDTVGGSAAITNDYSSGDADVIDDIKASARQLIRSEEWFEAYEQELAQQEQKADRILRAASRLQSSIALAISQVALDSGSLLSDSAVQLTQEQQRYASNYLNPAAILTAREAELEEGDVKRQLKEQKKETEAQWKKAKKLLSSLAALEPLEEHREQFALAEQSYKNSLAFNQTLIEAKEHAQEQLNGDAEEAHASAAESSQVMKGIFAGMAGMLEKKRDDFYYGEYALNRFQSFPPDRLRALLEEGDMTELTEALSFYNQEAEYVLYGLHHPIGNLSAAYGELFAVRLAIRTMEGLIESRHLGHPLLILSASLIYGLQKTMEDMLSFTKSGSAPLSKYARIDVSYKDYIRLFMLLHGGNEQSRLSRMIAVIENNRKIKLSEVPAAAVGEARASIKLWFIPGLIKLLGVTGQVNGSVNGGRYEMAETMGSSYE